MKKRRHPARHRSHTKRSNPSGPTAPPDHQTRRGEYEGGNVDPRPELHPHRHRQDGHCERDQQCWGAEDGPGEAAEPFAGPDQDQSEQADLDRFPPHTDRDRFDLVAAEAHSVDTCFHSHAPTCSTPSLTAPPIGVTPRTRPNRMHTNAADSRTARSFSRTTMISPKTTDAPTTDTGQAARDGLVSPRRGVPRPEARRL